MSSATTMATPNMLRLEVMLYKRDTVAQVLIAAAGLACSAAGNAGPFYDIVDKAVLLKQVVSLVRATQLRELFGSAISCVRSM